MSEESIQDKISLSERIFEGKRAEVRLELQLDDAGAEFETTAFDDYDNSIELYDVPETARLTVEAQKIIHDAGFFTCRLNHVDKWETHYRFNPAEPFRPSEGWRVSYPQKRGENEHGIWLEKPVDDWPKEWFETGHAVVKAPQS